MLFNGKYYNKPGHLGMTRQQLIEALAGGGGGGKKGTITFANYEMADHTITAGEVLPFVDYLNDLGLTLFTVILIADETVTLSVSGENILHVTLFNQSSPIGEESTYLDWTGGTKPVTGITGAVSAPGWNEAYYLINDDFNITVNLGH